MEVSYEDIWQLDYSKPKSKKGWCHVRKKCVLGLLFVLTSFTLSGCGFGHLFYKIYHETNNEISRGMDNVNDYEQNLLEEVFISAMEDTNAAVTDAAADTPPLLTITSSEGSAPLCITDASVISSYIRETGAFISKGILTEISHNYTKLPKAASDINTFTLWKHYDDGLAESNQPYACCFKLYEYQNRYYIKAEFNDARIEDSPYYLPLDEADSSYLLALSAGEFDYLPEMNETEMDTENDTLESYSIKESLSDIDYEGVAQVSKHQKIEIRSAEGCYLYLSSICFQVPESFLEYIESLTALEQ